MEGMDGLDPADIEKLPKGAQVTVIFDTSMGEFMAIPRCVDPSQQPKEEEDYIWPQYRLKPLLLTEKRFLRKQRPGITNDQIKALILANKSNDASENEKYQDAAKMCFEAIALDPNCIDAYSYLAKAMLCFDEDMFSSIEASRELLIFARMSYEPLFKMLSNGTFYNCAPTRPYIRLISNIGTYARCVGDIELAIYCYEELIRLNHRDNTGARSPLMAAYIEVLGRKRNNPTYQFQRTFQVVDQFLSAKLDTSDNTNVFGDDRDDVNVRYFDLVSAFYHKSRNLTNLIKKENQRNSKMVDCVLRDKKIEINDPEVAGMFNQFVYGNKNDEVYVHGAYLVTAMQEWPDLLANMMSVVRKLPKSRILEDTLRQLSYNHKDTININSLLNQKLIKEGNEKLELGRKLMTNKDILKAYLAFSEAKAKFETVAMNTRTRWYQHAPFAIVSNRCTCAVILKEWNIARIDARFTLEMKPDHQRTYEKLPLIAEAFGAPRIKAQLELNLKKIAEGTVKTENQWKQLAQYSSVAISLTSLILSKNRSLTEEMLQEMLKRGIDDMYTPVNLKPDMFPMLPWVPRDSLECEQTGLYK
ncbi:TPR Domain containing protein [Tritrichomonas foetus]|uniref:TPR Domain containing protein n=1 Tax=Tritrichomonas foetus TaxID=1144522 RepID=A0A1J4K2W8_9EUKA|nr:TPR Domain containing protein [Tritrichomonas foetus]|eukprot:OHT04078.1 TPR Domain containing protein [Tritrichomonas foetus]